MTVPQKSSTEVVSEVPGDEQKVSFWFLANLLQSRELEREVATTTYHSANPSFDGDLVQYYKIDVLSRDQAVARAVRTLGSALDVSADRNTGVVSVQVTTESPEISEQIVNR